MKTLTFDIETYPNYTLFALQNIETKELYIFEIRGADERLSDKNITNLHKLLTENKIITFNGIKFDEPITAIAIYKKSSAFELFKSVQSIIVDKLSYYKLYHAKQLKPFIKNHIDVMDVAMGVASLKLYGARLGVKKLQDLPYEIDTYLTKEQMQNVCDYCINDLNITQTLYEELLDDIDLRYDLSNKYDLNLMSDNGARIAEKILIKSCNYKGEAPNPPTHIYYTPPKYIKFKTDKLKSIFNYITNHKFLLNSTGNIELPAKLKQEKIEIDGITYQMGIGGVHASVSNTSIYADKKNTILDIDYKALYPSLMIQNNFIPQHLGKKFMKVYKGMYDERIAVKESMKNVEYGSDAYKKLDTHQKGLKLVNNSSFGKLGLKYSKMYDPKALLHITLTGQLTLMMVVEKLHLKGFKVFYANTDGITLKVRNKDVKKVQDITRKFDKKTGLEMEYDEFRSCHIRDVNNFINITKEGKVKSKGVYAPPSLNKNSQVPIVYEAVRLFLQNGTSVQKTISECKDVNSFCSSRTVKGGAMYGYNIPELYPAGWEDKLNSKRGLTKKIIAEREKMEASWVKDNGLYLGKVVRWYYSTNGRSIHYKSNGNKVPTTDGCKPMMELSDKLPKDLDISWYVTEAYKILEEELGYEID